MNTACSICSEPCPGHADSPNPLCNPCLELNFSSVEMHWLDREVSASEEAVIAYNRQQIRLLNAIAQVQARR